MADNTTLGPTAGGDAVRDIDRGSAKTQVVQLDAAGGVGAESLVSGQNPLPAMSPLALTQAKMILQTIQLAAAAPLAGFVPIETPDFLLG